MITDKELIELCEKQLLVSALNTYAFTELLHRFRNLTENKPSVEAVINAMEILKCEWCNGHGYTSEHDPLDPHENGCSNCPIQVQCERCHGEGHYYTVSTLRTAIESVLNKTNT